MAITSNAPIPRAPVSESKPNEETGKPEQILTQPFGVFLRDLRSDIDAAPIQVKDGVVSVSGSHAAVITTDIITPEVSGLFNFAYYSEVTSADVLSSLQPVLGWTSHGVTRSHSFSIMAGALTATNASEDYMFYADAGAPITYALTYPAGTMVYNFYAVLSSVAGVA